MIHILRQTMHELQEEVTGGPRLYQEKESTCFQIGQNEWVAGQPA